MAIKPRETVTFRDTALIFKNFAGEAKKFNKEGERNFSILLSEADALDLEKKGWNVRPLKRREEDDEQLYHLKVKVAYANRPPRVWLISSGARTMIGDGLIGMFDHLEFTRVDLVISAYNWQLDTGASGKTAYLQSMFATMYEDELEQEYADVPQLSTAGDAAPVHTLEAAPDVYTIEGDFEER